MHHLNEWMVNDTHKMLLRIKMYQYKTPVLTWAKFKMDLALNPPFHCP